jgi:exopolysaccharide biosynthesis polyprenyl glycosylphosphotransferase
MAGTSVWARKPGARDEPGARSVEGAPGSASRLRRDLVGVDLVALLLAWGTLPLSAGPERRLHAVLACLALIACSLALVAGQRLYLARVCAVRSLEIVRLARVCALIVLLIIVVAGLHEQLVPSEVLVIHALLAFLLLVVGRGLFRSWLRVSRAEGHHTRSVAIVGMNDEAEDLIQLLHDEPGLGYRVIGAFHEANAELGLVPWLGPIGSTVATLRAESVNGVIVIVSALGACERQRLLSELFAAGIHVQVSVGLDRVGLRRLRSLPVAHEPTFYVEPPQVSTAQLMIKRAMDLVLGSFALLVTAPVVAVAAIAVLLDDGRPVLFRQTRVGRDGRTFSLLKLRTMCRDAEARLDGLRDQNARVGPLFKMTDDPRVTTVGRFLRATSIDELPQLLNVLRGEMSLVGPRPPLPKEVKEFDSELQARFRVRPGITGLWQVEARENPSFRLYRHLDLFYLDNRSISLDLAILVATVELLVGRTIAKAWVHRRRARPPEVAGIPSAAPAGSPSVGGVPHILTPAVVNAPREHSTGTAVATDRGIST